ncbi:MAG: F0F1 ATP synthase subunit delta [Actinomyces sp.]
MNTGTAASRAAAARAWSPVVTGAGGEAQTLGEQILQIAHIIASGSLFAPLTDPGRSGDDKAALATRLLAGRADDRVVELLAGLVRHRWSKAMDLVTALHDMGIETILAGARAAGTLDDVEQQVFEVSVELERDQGLREALEPSRRASTDARVRLARRIFSPMLSGPAMSLVIWCVRHRSQSGVTRNLRRVVELAAGMQNRAIADVVSAVPLTTAQEARLRAVLIGRLGEDVEINSTVDPSVIGGVKVTVRDTVIDSTVRSSLDGLRVALAG